MQFSRGCHLWGRVCPFPLPPASCLLRGWAGSSWLALLWNCSVPLFCEWPAVCLSQLIFSLSLAIPKFKLISHVSSLQFPSGHSDLVLTLSNATRSSPFHTYLLVVDAGVWGTFLLGVAFRRVICGFYLLFLPVRLPSKIRKLPQTSCERVSWCLETSSVMAPFPGRVSIPSSFVSLFIFYILSYLLLKTMGCFSGCLMSSASGQKLFCKVCSAFKCSFDEFVGEKVVSSSYSSAILAPPRSALFIID